MLEQIILKLTITLLENKWYMFHINKGSTCIWVYKTNVFIEAFGISAQSKPWMVEIDGAVRDNSG
jgi:hypothetical protein